MKKSQLNAISRAYSKKEAERLEALSVDLNIDLVFKYQTTYKTLRGFIAAYGTSNFEKALNDAQKKLDFEYREKIKAWCGTMPAERFEQLVKGLNSNYLAVSYQISNARGAKK